MKVDAIVRPKGRSIAVVPFGVIKGRATLGDGIKLAEFTARKLRSVFDDLKVYGPSSMRDVLKSGMNESRWIPIARHVNADLLVVGEITFLEAYYDKLLQTREGVMGVRARVLDVSGPEAELVKFLTCRFSFPEEVGEKFDPKYIDMGDMEFRHEVLRFGAGWLAGVFYDHLEKRRPVRRFEVKSRDSGGK
jgi:hypothetical protein